MCRDGDQGQPQGQQSSHADRVKTLDTTAWVSFLEWGYSVCPPPTGAGSGTCPRGHARPAFGNLLVSDSTLRISSSGYSILLLQQNDHPGGAWVAQLVKRPSLDFSSGHGLTVGEIQPHFGLQADSKEPA